MCRWKRRQTLPIHPGHQPVPLRLRDLENRVARRRPDETAPVQTALAQPNAVAVPQQQLQAVARPVAEHERGACARRMPQRLLDDSRQAVSALAHVHGRHRQPNVRWAGDQPRHRHNSASQAADTPGGSSSRWPPACRNTKGSDAGIWTCTGMRAGDGGNAGCPRRYSHKRAPKVLGFNCCCRQKSACAKPLACHASICPIHFIDNAIGIPHPKGQG